MLTALKKFSEIGFESFIFRVISEGFFISEG